MFANLSRRSCSNLMRSTGTRWVRNLSTINLHKSPLQVSTSAAVMKPVCHQQRSLLHTTSQVSSSFNVQDEDDFHDRVIKSGVPVVTDFHAEWCGPCKLLGPRIEAEVAKHDGKIVLAKVDIDDMPELAMKYKINVVPSVLLFKGGSEVNRFQGNVDDDLLKHFVAKEI